MDSNTMKFVIALLCLAATSFGQTYRTVTAETNNVIRTNFTIPVAQVSGAMATNGDAAGLTNFPASLLRTNGDGSGLTNLPNLNLTNATGILPISNGGTGATNAALAISNLLPSYTGNSNRILALNSNATTLLWTTNTGGGGGGGGAVDLASTNVTGILPITKGGTGGTNTESAVLGLGILNTNDYRVNLFYGGTNAGNQHIVIGPFAQAFGTNFNENAVVIGRSASVTNNGVAIGYSPITQSGIAVGYNAQSEGRGVAIGNYAVALGGTIDDVDLGGVAIGPDATASTNMGVAIGATAAAEGNGVSIGYDADSRGDTNGGVALGYGADVYEGIGIGVYATANNGVAIGANAVDANEGVAIGIRASTVNGAAIGIDAVSDVGYQIGTGTNGESLEPTIQFMNAGEVYTNQWTALANSTVYGHQIMAAPTNGTNGQILALNSNATAVVWTNAGGGGGLPETPLAISNGGTGGSSAESALTNLTLISGNRVKLGTDTTNTSNAGITIGGGAALGVNSPSVVIGSDAFSTGTESVVIGRVAKNTNVASAVVIGLAAKALDFSTGAIAIGVDAIVGATAQSPGAVQIGSGSNSISNTIQFRQAGSISTNEWATLAALSTYPTTNIQVTVVGGATNTLVFSNGILTSVTTP
jgi:hypothetical protein